MVAVSVCVIVVCVCSISRSLQLNSARGPDLTLTTMAYPFSSLALLAWDYSISHREAALAQSAGIAISFRVRRSAFRHTRTCTFHAHDLCCMSDCLCCIGTVSHRLMPVIILVLVQVLDVKSLKMSRRVMLLAACRR